MKRHRFTAWLCATGLALAALGCERDETVPADDPAKRPVPGVASRTNEPSTEVTVSATNREVVVAEVDRRLKQLDAKIEDLSRKASALSADARVELDSAMASLREERSRLSARLEQAKQASSESWRELRIGFENAVSSLEQAFEKAKAEFQAEKAR